MPKRRTLTRAARAAETREAMIETATRLFLRSGIEATSLDAVAAQLGLTKGAVYARFPSKGALVEAVASANTTPVAVFAALLEPGVALATRLKAFAERLVASEVSRRAVLLDLEYVIYAARNGLWEKADRTQFEAGLAALATRFREVNRAAGERLPMAEKKFLLLLNILGRGLVQELVLHPGSLEVADVTRMVALLAPATKPTDRRDRRWPAATMSKIGKAPQVRRLATGGSGRKKLPPSDVARGP